MDHRNLILFLSGLAAVGAAVTIAVSCSDQPKVKCTAGRGRFAASYTTAMALPDAGCNMLGEELGVEVYNQPNAGGTNIDPSKQSIWIRGQSISNAIGERGGVPDMAHSQNSIGQFETAEPGDDTFCKVGNLTPAEQDLPDAGDFPPTSIKYEWSNLRFVVAPRTEGSQLVGDLTYTRDGCTANYHVTALYPAVTCEVDGTALDFCKCLYYGDPTPEYDRPKGSGISPDLFGFAPTFGDAACDKSAAQAQAMEDASKVKCDHVTHLCVLKGDPPQ
jgi:hypothetical protein